MHFNEEIWAFYRFWHMPEPVSTESKDFWLLLEADIIFDRGRIHITCKHLNAVAHSIMIINKNNNQLIKASRAVPGKTIQEQEWLDQVAEQAINVKQWEIDNGQHWPWALMTEHRPVHERFKRKYGDNNTMYYQSVPDNYAFQKITSRYAVAQPCRTCGGNKNKLY